MIHKWYYSSSLGVKVALFLILIPFLSACGPTREELDATATPFTADIYPTQTTDVPTVTPTPSPAPTVTPAGPVSLLRAHAHNDYQHAWPLYDALEQGFVSVEVDIHLVGAELLVAHDADQVQSGRTLRSLYLDPLRKRIRHTGGSVYSSGVQFTLLIDIKSEAEPTYEILREILKDYKDILTTFGPNDELAKGPILAIISGNRPRDLMEREAVRYAAYDGRLDDLGSGVPSAFIPLISDNWTKHFTWNGVGPMPEEERQKLRAIVEEAHLNGQRVRFWATPDVHPARKAVWMELIAAGVDMINTDYLRGLRQYLLENDPWLNTPIPTSTPAILDTGEQPLETCLDLEPLGSNPLNFPTYHVQGLAVTEDFYYITSVDRDSGRGRLFKVDRNTLLLMEEKELTKGALIHPGGIEMDGVYLWIPNAEYDRDGPSEILALDPQSLEVSRTFSVDDHISLIASNGTDRLYGTNWDTVNFYAWDWDGNLIEIVTNPTDIAYQDCEFSDPYLICGGTKNGGGFGTIDYIDPESWTVVYRIEVGSTSLGHRLTREGLSLFGDEVFLLPEDDPDSEIMIYQVCDIP